MIIAFLSTELIILNRDARYDSVKKIIKIIGISLKKMKENKIPRILKTIYIQTIFKKPKKTLEEMLENFNYDKNAFDTINFEYIHLPSLSIDVLEDYENIIDYPLYKENLDNILNKITKAKNYNSIGNIIEYIDIFNETVNGNSGFNSQTVLKELELDFIEIYNRHENKLKNELTQKIIELKNLERKNESFGEFIEKNDNLKFTFEIKNEEFTFYGGCEDFNEYYDHLSKNKTFKIEPKDIVLNIKSRLLMPEGKRKQEEKSTKEEERKKLLEERRRFIEERRRFEEERKRFEEKRRRFEEETRRFEEETRIFKEERIRFELERIRFEEERIRFEEERIRFEDERK